MTSDIKSGTQGFDAPGGGSHRRGPEDGFGLLHGRGDGHALPGRSGRQGQQGLSRENELELEKLRLAWKGEAGPKQERGGPGEAMFSWRRQEEDGALQGSPDWARLIDEFPLIAQYTPATSLTALFEPPPATVAGPRHPLSENVEQIVNSLLNRMELNPLEKMHVPRANFELALDKSLFGISGINLSMTAGSLSVLLVGVTDPANPALAAAGQQLVRDLQRNTGVRSVRLHACGEDAVAGLTEPDGNALPLVHRKDMHQHG